MGQGRSSKVGGLGIPESVGGSFCLRGTNGGDDLWSDSRHACEATSGQVRQQRRNTTAG